MHASMHATIVSDSKNRNTGSGVGLEESAIAWSVNTISSERKWNLASTRDRIEPRIPAEELGNRARSFFIECHH